MMRFQILLFVLLLISINSLAQSGGELCESATVISSIPYVAIGSTNEASDDYFASCPDIGNPGGAADLVYEFTNGPEDIYVDINLCEAVTNYDCQLYIYEGDCSGDPVGCQEDGCQSPEYGAPYNSRLVAQFLQANTTYYIIIDGYSDDSEGDYQINISESIGLEAPAETNLPLILIDTEGEDIPDEPKITANLKIIYNGPGALNHPTDPANVYDGFMGIEIRGAYSASLPQKPFGIETRDEFGENNNVSILDMPSENDWILLANYNDKTFFRNVLAFDLFTKMGHYAPRTQLCEVVINDIYEGVYVFTEKIKRDNGRIDIAKLDFDDNAGDSLTGGYIFKIDYWDWDNSWLSDYENPNYPGNDVRYVHEYPDVEDITDQQQDYIQNKVQQFEDALWSDDFMDDALGYRQYINVKSFMDYLLVNEFARNWDGFKKSRVLHKDRDDNDPKIYAGPVWDFDWAYKDINDEYSNGEGWLHSFTGGTDVTPPGWYIRMMQDSTFTNDLACRYDELRGSVMSNENLNSYIDSLGVVVADASDRHYTRWPILGANVGTPEIGDQPETYDEELIKFKGWIEERLEWLDENMPGMCIGVGIDELENKVTYSSVYPNPSLGELNIYAATPISSVDVFDVSGRLVKTIDGNGQNLISHLFTDLEGVYSFHIVLRDGIVLTHLVVLR